MAFSDTLANLDASINQGIAQRGKTIDQMGVFQQTQRQLYQQDTGKILDMLQNYNKANARKAELAQGQKDRLAAITAEYDRRAMEAQSQREADAIKAEKDRQLKLELQKMADEQAAANRATDVRIAAARSGGSSKQSDLMDTFMSRVTPVMLRGGYIDPVTQAFDWKGANADAKSLRNLFQTGLQDLPQDEQNKLMNIFDAYLNGQQTAPAEVPPAKKTPSTASVAPTTLGGLGGGATTAGQITSQAQVQNALSNAKEIQDKVTKLLSLGVAGSAPALGDISQRVKSDVAALNDAKSSNDQAAIDEINSILKTLNYRPNDRSGLFDRIGQGAANLYGKARSFLPF